MAAKKYRDVFKADSNKSKVEVDKKQIKPSNGFGR
jgi:hypothetical protein